MGTQAGRGAGDARCGAVPRAVLRGPTCAGSTEMYSRLQEQSGASCRAGAPAELAAVPCRCDCERATWHGRACHV